MSKKKTVSIKVSGYGELKGSVRERLERIRRAFEGAASQKAKKLAVLKMNSAEPV